MKTKERNIVVAIILSLVTCGIYAIYWFIVVTDEIKEASGDQEMQSGGIAFLLTLITCGIYGFFWAYQVGKASEKLQTKIDKQPSDTSILYIILYAIGLSIVIYALAQNDLNEYYRISAGGVREQA